MPAPCQYTMYGYRTLTWRKAELMGEEQPRSCTLEGLTTEPQHQHIDGQAVRVAHTRTFPLWWLGKKYCDHSAITGNHASLGLL